MTEEPRVTETFDETPLVEESEVERSIADELERLGKQLAGAAKAAWESEERRKLQDEITTGVQRFGQEISAAVNKATESEPAKEVLTRAEKVAVDIQKTDVVDEVRKGILVGLEAINRELGKLLERLETKPGEAEMGEPEMPVVSDVTPDEPMPTE